MGGVENLQKYLGAFKLKKKKHPNSEGFDCDQNILILLIRLVADDKLPSTFSH